MRRHILGHLGKDCWILGTTASMASVAESFGCGDVKGHRQVADRIIDLEGHSDGGREDFLSQRKRQRRAEGGRRRAPSISAEPRPIAPRVEREGAGRGVINIAGARSVSGMLLNDLLMIDLPHADIDTDSE